MDSYYSPPDPYGSYLSFDGRFPVAYPSYQPSGSRSAGMMGMMGEQSSFNPTSAEQEFNRLRELRNSRYMYDAMGRDPRVPTQTHALLNILSRNEPARAQLVNMFGGRGDLNSQFGMLFNQSGMSNWFGGNYETMAMGAYQMASSGFLRAPGNLPMNGDGPVQTMMANSLLQKVTSSFFTPGGLPITRMGHNLNMNQLGGLMGIMANNGSFQGLQPLVTSNNMVAEDPAAMQEVVKRIEKSARVLSVMMNAFGNGPIADLVRKSSMVTGMPLAQPETIEANLRAIGQFQGAARLTGRSMAEVMSYSEQTAGGLAAMGVNPAFAAGVSTRALLAERSNRTYNSIAGGYLPTVPLNNLLQSGIANAAAMVNDPGGIGATAITALSGSLGLSGGSLREAQMQLLQAGQMGQGAVEALFNQKTGMSLRSYVQAQGGPSKLNNLVSPALMGGLSELTQRELQQRSLTILQRHMTGNFGSSLGAGLTLLSQVDPKYSGHVIDLYNQGASSASLLLALQDDPIGRSRGQDIVQGLLSGGWGNDMVKRGWLTAQQRIRQDPVLQHMAGFNAFSSRLTSLPWSNANEFQAKYGQMHSSMAMGLLSALSGENPGDEDILKAALAFRGDPKFRGKAGEKLSFVREMDANFDLDTGNLVDFTRSWNQLRSMVKDGGHMDWLKEQGLDADMSGMSRMQKSAFIDKFRLAAPDVLQHFMFGKGKHGRVVAAFRPEAEMFAGLGGYRGILNSLQGGLREQYATKFGLSGDAWRRQSTIVIRICTGSCGRVI